MEKPTILLVPVYQSFARESERPYSLNYTNSEKELAVTRFTYSKGRNNMGFYQQITGQRSSRNIHDFDTQGRMFRKHREFSDKEVTEEIFLYDEKGRLIEETFSSSKGIEGITKYEYDVSGNATRMVCDHYKGWFNGILKFHFDSDGKRLTGQIWQNGEETGSIEYRYDRQGTLQQEHWDIGNGKWSQTLLYVYEPVSKE
ncbi:MAG: hypothetical protein ACO3ZW_08990 [Opitutales bacterium]